MQVLINIVSPSGWAGRSTARPAPQTQSRFGRSYGSFTSIVQSFAAALFVFASCALPAQAQGPQPIQVVALGDSLTAGYRLPQNEAFPAVLQRALRKAGWNVNIVNAGVSGDTATDGLDRLDWSVGKNADAVILELGANDMLRGI
ncbi:MAG TPA: GDSL-type esterase/lipase family protein, partial [Beijerinckiaceae bacterium]|nr:GDSL-type esterase/lipase family protein [Beijerinckiaceae bacterium]